MSAPSQFVGRLLKGPGWYPGTPRLGDPADIPEVGVVRDRMGVVIHKSMCMCPNCFECHIHIQVLQWTLLKYRHLLLSRSVQNYPCNYGHSVLQLDPC